MLTVEECRKKLGERGEDLSDEEIIQLRDAVYQVAETVIDDHLERKTP